MRSFLLLAIPGALGIWSRPALAATKQPVTVLVFNYAGVSQPVLAAAQREAGRIAGSADVELTWRDRSEQSGQPAPACSQSPGLSQLVLHLLPGGSTRRLAEPGAFGVSLPAYAGRPGFFAAVFWDRVVQFASPRITEPVLLGHVIAHELGHLLLGANRHSGEGIMKAHWRNKDLELARLGQLVFSGSESRRISENLNHAQAGLASARPAPNPLGR